MSYSRISLIRAGLILNLFVFSFVLVFYSNVSSPSFFRSTSNTSLSPNQFELRLTSSYSSSQNWTSCDDLTSAPFIGQRGPYWVLYNYIRPLTSFRCSESVTYSTHSDFTFLDNLKPLLERWKGPVSIGLYAPGSDFTATLDRIRFLRECNYSALIKEYVTFHIFFESGQLPTSAIPKDPDTLPPFDCTTPPNFGEDLMTYRKSHNLTYPVNVARNVAREMSTTYFVLASDIELYPSPNLIPNFLHMIKKNDFEVMESSPNPKVFVLPIFEVDKKVQRLPDDKTELQAMLKKKTAIPFHKFVCPYCHKVPHQDEWISTKEDAEMSIFHVGKRQGSFNHWEPIYIGTKFEPNYDERLSWEGQKDKMTQGYVLCVLDYEFHILNNAFLVHRPGIKMPKKGKHSASPFVKKQNSLISTKIHPELKLLYGERSGCDV